MTERRAVRTASVAVTGAGAVLHHQSMRDALDDLLGVLGTSRDRARAAIVQLQTENKRLTREISQLKIEGARTQHGATSGVQELRFARGVFVGQELTGLSKEELRQLVDQHRDRIKTGIVAVASTDGKDARTSLVLTPAHLASA